MGVNILIVMLGLFLISLAIIQLVHEPEKLEIWIMPGGARLFGILITMFFYNPRQNALEDFTELMNANVISCGFYGDNQIDATFNHGFIENRSFGIHRSMDQTVKQIDGAVTQTLKMAEEYTRSQKGLQVRFKRDIHS